MTNKKSIFLVILFLFVWNFNYIFYFFNREKFLVFNSRLEEDVVYNDKIKSFITHDKQYLYIDPFFFPMRTHEDDVYVLSYLNELNYAIFFESRSSKEYDLILKEIKNNNFKRNYTQISSTDTENEITCSIINHIATHHTNYVSILGRDIDSPFISRETKKNTTCDVIFFNTNYDNFVIAESHFHDIILNNKTIILLMKK